MIKRIHSTLLLCKDLDQTARFYEKVGFTVEVSNDAVRIIFGDYRLAFIDEKKSYLIQDGPDAKKGVGMFIYFEVDNVDSFYQMLKEKNITALSEPKRRRAMGKREFAIKDPDGYKLIFFSPSIG